MRIGRLIGMVCLLVAGAACRGTAAEVSLCADIWCPYNCDQSSPLRGFAVDIAQEVFGPLGYHVTYESLSWARCVEDARSGRFTGIIGAIRPDAPDFIFPVQPIGISGDAYAVRRGDPFHFTGPESLRGRVLGIIRDYSFSGPIGAYIAAHRTDGTRVEAVSGDGAINKNLAKLVAGRIDVVVDDLNVLRNSVGRLGLQDRVTLSSGLDRTPVYIAFSPSAKQPKQLAALLDAGIERLRASGRLQQIMARYNLADSH